MTQGDFYGQMPGDEERREREAAERREMSMRIQDTKSNSAKAELLCAFTKAHERHRFLWEASSHGVLIKEGCLEVAFLAEGEWFCAAPVPWNGYHVLSFYLGAPVLWGVPSPELRLMAVAGVAAAMEVLAEAHEVALQLFAIARLPPESPALAAMVFHHDERVRSAAYPRLPPDSPILEVFRQKGWSWKDNRDRYLAIRYLPKDFPSLRILARSQDWQVRCSVTYALPPDSPVLASLSSDMEREVRGEVALHIAPGPELVALSRDKDSSVRVYAAMSLPPDSPALAAMVHDPEDHVRQILAEKLPPNSQALACLAGDKERSVRMRVAWQIDPSSPVLDLLTQDSDPVVQRRARIHMCSRAPKPAPEPEPVKAPEPDYSWFLEGCV